MNERVTIPIETTMEGEKITKVCVEDVYKIVNRIQDNMSKAWNNSVDIINTLNNDKYGGEECSVIIGTGVSQPCGDDVFNEDIGNNIAFMKAKLNANIKKHNFMCRIYNEWIDYVWKLSSEIDRVDDNIKRDLNGIRKYNSEYLPDVESKLGIYYYPSDSFNCQFNEDEV